MRNFLSENVENPRILHFKAAKIKANRCHSRKKEFRADIHIVAFLRNATGGMLSA